MRAARFDVSTELLEKLMKLPFGARIIGCEKSSPIDSHVTFVVDDPNLPEAERPHDCIPSVQEIVWRWNLGE